ncbi:MAG: sulfite exporter TauE/SafE family protein [Bacteroidota bacterium]
MREKVLRLLRLDTRAVDVNNPNLTRTVVVIGLLIIIVPLLIFAVVNLLPLLLEEDSLPLVGTGFYIAVAGGFIAQLIDGALGMAYGVSATTIMTSLGVSHAAATASVHTSEIFTSGVSGWFHLKFKNVNKKLVRTLLIPGVIGAILGAYVLSSLQEYSSSIKPIVAIYTLYLGIRIIRKAVVNFGVKKPVKRIGWLAAVGGFLDSVGGGGWGPIVSSSLISRGRHPMYTIGSVNLTEFFVSFASAFTFSLFLNIQTYWQIILGLVIGGVIAAPLGAILPKKLPVKQLLIMVGIVVSILSIRNFITSF